MQRKNRTALTPAPSGPGPWIERERAGRGYKHLITESDLLAFISLIPDWDRVSYGLTGVLLARRRQGWEGSYNHDDRVISICAWEKNLWRTVDLPWYREHEELFGRLGVECAFLDGQMRCKFTMPQAKAYQLLHVFLHELGHHQHSMGRKRKGTSGGGEEFAEAWTLEMERELWTVYFE